MFRLYENKKLQALLQSENEDFWGHVRSGREGDRTGSVADGVTQCYRTTEELQGLNRQLYAYVNWPYVSAGGGSGEHSCSEFRRFPISNSAYRL
jgi:hypothetical protein